jgi:hypothetical protein
MYAYRPDLIQNGLYSGVIMLVCSLPSYFLIQYLSASWIANVYQFNHLSGILLWGIPIEELVFWFLAGSMFGPFYEYARKIRLVRGGVYS